MKRVLSTIPAPVAALALCAATGAASARLDVGPALGSGHAFMLGFNAWYRAWTMQSERLVLNAILYPHGTAIPAGAVFARRAGAYAQAPEAPVPAASLPSVASRPVNPTGAIGKDVGIRVPAAQADELRAAVREARLPAQIRSHVRFVTGDSTFAVVIEEIRVGSRSKSAFMGAIAEHRIRAPLGQT